LICPKRFAGKSEDFGGMPHRIGALDFRLRGKNFTSSDPHHGISRHAIILTYILRFYLTFYLASILALYLASVIPLLLSLLFGSGRERCDPALAVGVWWGTL